MSPPSKRPPGSRPLPYPRATEPAQLALPRWIGPLAIGSIVGFLLWIVYLGFTLPEKVRTEHYDIAWLGFDSAMWTMLAALTWLALRRHPATGPVAAVACMMLIVDAWFDIFTSSTKHDEMAFAVVMALCAELPLAIVCGWVAVHVERIRARAYRSLLQRWERAVRSADGALQVSQQRSAPRPR